MFGGKFPAGITFIAFMRFSHLRDGFFGMFSSDLIFAHSSGFIPAVTSTTYITSVTKTMNAFFTTLVAHAGDLFSCTGESVEVCLKLLYTHFIEFRRFIPVNHGLISIVLLSSHPIAMCVHGLLS